MRRHRPHAIRRPADAGRFIPRPPRGFTLVEMLVATALVLLMLMLFAQIFGTAVGSMRNQQAQAQNDQKARAVDTQLRSDLAKATFRQPRVKGVYGLVPLTPTGPIDAARQRGFLYFSENNHHDPSDNVLHWTIDLRVNDRDPTPGILRGRAAIVGGAADLNQPEYDDGLFGNGIGESPAAEVAYFVRDGNLYRRQLLLREPPTPTAPVSPSRFSAQPGIGPTGAELIPPDTINDRLFVGPYTTPAPLRSFWNDFDYSTWNWARDEDGDGTPETFWLMFNGVDSLQNTIGATPFPIAVPQHRFGHFPDSGQPIEFAAPYGFIGRYTHEETSNPGFAYPGASHVPPAAALDSFVDGPRSGEDLILSGVEAFEIDVWDDGFSEPDLNGNGVLDGFEDVNGNGVRDLLPPQWVELGHETDLGYFRAIAGVRNPTHGRQNTGYGALGVPDNRCFDTWHPLAASGVADMDGLFHPPFAPLRVPVVFDPGTGPLPTSAHWAPLAGVPIGQLFFPGVEDINLNGIDDGDDDRNGNGILDPADPTFYYAVIGFLNPADPSTHATGFRQPEWPREPGQTLVDGGVIWKCFDNRIGLQMIRITIRYRDPGANLPRQMTIVHSFVE
ncbi:MAG: prepilin-type N-terminal cleavage/methylation domain-containing protein [Planctomyces sp.]|nr:prepilin-type N-terminal cleavage/methylation domain-containing protein [Planctomyces sp.]